MPLAACPPVLLDQVRFEDKPNMQRYEFKHVRWKVGFTWFLLPNKWERELMTILTQQGNQGWDLKSIVYEMGLHYHLIFSRPVPSGQAANWSPERCTCGYDLTGNTSGVCPECGKRVTVFPP